MKRRLTVSIDEELLDAIEVECEILVIHRSKAVEEGLRHWLDEVRRRQAAWQR